MFKKLFFVLLVLSFSVLVFALDDQGNPNDPTINERANACYEDGSMAGKCLTAWDWEGGWYLIRFQSGLISRENFPLQFVILLPPLPEDLANDKPYSYPTAGCVFILTNAMDGIGRYSDFNGGNFLSAGHTWYINNTCDSGYTTTSPYDLAYAPNGSADAVAICQAHGFTGVVVDPENSDVYICT
jgi:hypothetical protein